MPRLMLSHDPEAFYREVQGFLELHEAENALLLGFLSQLAAQPPSEPPFLARLAYDGETLGVAYLTHLNLIVSRGMDLAAEELVSVLAQRGLPVPGLVGPLDEVVSFSRAWIEIRGCEVSHVIEQMVYELQAIDWPGGIPGQIRPMGEGDVDRVAEWLQGFHRDALPHEPYSRETARAGAEARPSLGMTYLWEVEGEAVAMASLARPTRRGITVNAVYTPPEHRSKGYATALVAALSDEGLRRGKEFCVLYTDLDNPTSNAIYQRIGYRPVARSRNVRFRLPG